MKRRGVVGKAGVAALGDDALYGLVVETEVEDRVHHPRHRGAGPGTHRDQQRVGAVAELLAHELFNPGQVLVDLGLETGRVVAVVLVEFGADFGGDGEPGRHRQADAGHLRQVGSLAAQQILHVATPFGNPIAEEIDILCHETLLPDCWSPLPCGGVSLESSIRTLCLTGIGRIDSGAAQNYWMAPHPMLPVDPG